MQNLIDELSPLCRTWTLNATQAARVADVQRPVVANWARRHESFPQALASDATSETRYSALDFVVWASERPQAKRTFEQMIVAAALESHAGAPQNLQVSANRVLESLAALMLAYRSVDFLPGERPSGLLRRCAEVSAPLAHRLQGVLIAMKHETMATLAVPAYLVIRYSYAPIDDVRRYAGLIFGRLTYLRSRTDKT